jgi:hypothetical protein
MTSLRVHAAAVLSVLLLASGCGGGDGEDDKADDAGSSDSGSDFAEQSGDDIAAAAKEDMKALDSVAYAGEINSDGSTISLDVQANADGDCTGTIGIGEGTAEVLATDGGNWFRPDEAFWRQQAPDEADAIIAAVGDKWVIDSDANFSQFCDLEAFFDNIFKEDDEASAYEVTGTDEIDGQEVVKVEQTDEEGSSVGYVLVEGEHYLLKIERTQGDDPGTLEFSAFDEDVEVEAPADDEVVDPSTL